VRILIHILCAVGFLLILSHAAYTNNSDPGPDRDKRPYAQAGDRDRDSRFIAYDNGTVLDTKTGLMWAGKDNGTDITWEDAKQYCSDFRGGGYTDWRLPTLDELEGLYDRRKTGYQPECVSLNWKVYLTRFINLSCIWLRASDRSKTSVGSFNFHAGYRYFGFPSDALRSRVLPVRSG